MKRDVIGLGMCCMDLAVHIDELPTKKDQGARILQTSWQGGGNVASAIAAVGQLGGSASMMSVVGENDFGTFMIDDYHYYGVDTSHMIVSGETKLNVILSDEVTMGRNIMGRWGGPGSYEPRREYTVDDLDESFIAQHKVLHIERCNDTALAAIDMIHNAGGKVSIDAGGYHETTEAALDKIDIFVGSEFYYKTRFGDNEDYERNMKDMFCRDGQILVFTLGHRGAVVAWGDQFRYVPGFKVKVVDTVGAGDVYHGAFCYAYTQGMSPEECTRFSSAVSAIKCTSIGGRSGIPSRAMVDSFLKDGSYDRSLIEEKERRYETFTGHVSI